jgi:hypothetical protein
MGNCHLIDFLRLWMWNFIWAISMNLPYTLCLAGTELVSKLTKNVASVEIEFLPTVCWQYLGPDMIKSWLEGLDGPLSVFKLHEWSNFPYYQSFE